MDYWLEPGRESELAVAWLDYLTASRLATRDESVGEEWVLDIVYSEELRDSPRFQPFIVAAIEASTSDEDLRSLALGPLLDVLESGRPDAQDWADALAARNDRARHAVEIARAQLP